MGEQEGGTRKKAKERARKAGPRRGSHTHMHTRAQQNNNTHKGTQTHGNTRQTAGNTKHKKGKHRTVEKAMKTPQRWPLDGHTLSGGGSLPVS